MALDQRRIKAIGEWAKAEGIKRLRVGPDESLELEFFPESPESQAPVLTEKQRKEAEEEFRRKITYLSAGG